MAKRYRLSVQLQSGSSGACGIVRVNLIAENRMAEAHHVDTQLMCASGGGYEPQTGCVGFARQHLPGRDCRAAQFDINHLARSIGPVAHQRCIDDAFIPRHYSPHARDVDFCDLAELELTAQMPVSSPITRKRHDARSRLVKSMHNQCIGAVHSSARLNAIGKVRPPSRYAQQTARLGDDQQIGVRKQDTQILHGGRATGGGLARRITVAHGVFSIAETSAIRRRGRGVADFDKYQRAGRASYGPLAPCPASIPEIQPAPFIQ